MTWAHQLFILFFSSFCCCCCSLASCLQPCLQAFKQARAGFAPLIGSFPFSPHFYWLLDDRPRVCTDASDVRSLPSCCLLQLLLLLLLKIESCSPPKWHSSLSALRAFFLGICPRLFFLVTASISILVSPGKSLFSL